MRKLIWNLMKRIFKRELMDYHREAFDKGFNMAYKHVRLSRAFKEANCENQILTKSDMGGKPRETIFEGTGSAPGIFVSADQEQMIIDELKIIFSDTKESNHA